MAKAIKRRRGTTEEHKTFVGLDGEITVDTTKKTLVLHDQETAGGFPMARESSVTNLTAKVETLENKATQAETAIESKINKEEAEQTFVRKSGDTITGNLNMSSTGAAFLSFTKVDEGKSGDLQAIKSSNTRIGFLRFHNVDEENNSIYLSIVDNSGAQRGGLAINYNATTDRTITTAITPPIFANSTQIVTTDWATNRFAHNGNLTIYVRKTGNDSNDGLSESTAKLTINNALLYANLFNMAAGNITIDIGEGIWNENIVLRGFGTKGFIQNGGWFGFTGAGKDKTIISNATNVIVARQTSQFTMQNLTIENTGTGLALNSNELSRIFALNCKMNCNGSAIFTEKNSMIELQDCEINCSRNGGTTTQAIAVGRNSLVTVIGSLVVNGIFSSGTLVAYLGGILNVMSGVSITGNCSGRRYNVYQGGIIATIARGAEFIPGTLDGQVATGGLYL